MIWKSRKAAHEGCVRAMSGNSLGSFGGSHTITAVMHICILGVLYILYIYPRTFHTQAARIEACPPNGMYEVGLGGQRDSQAME